jgi:hypothetical protein
MAADRWRQQRVQGHVVKHREALRSTEHQSRERTDSELLHGQDAARNSRKWPPMNLLVEWTLLQCKEQRWLVPQQTVNKTYPVGEPLPRTDRMPLVTLSGHQ